MFDQTCGRQRGRCARRLASVFRAMRCIVRSRFEDWTVFYEHQNFRELFCLIMECRLRRNTRKRHTGIETLVGYLSGLAILSRIGWHRKNANALALLRAWWLFPGRCGPFRSEIVEMSMAYAVESCIELSNASRSRSPECLHCCELYTTLFV